MNSEKKFEAMYPQLVSGITTMSGEYTIRLKPEAPLFTIHTSRRVPIPLRNAVKVDCSRWNKDG